MVTFEEIQKANEQIKTTDIKGKQYAEVNQRVKAFRMVYPDGIISTEIVSNENGVCIIKAMVGYYEDGADGCVRWLGTGTAYEKENSTFINKTSYIENCETSAVGRALGMAGFGIDTSIASAEEVANAIEQQDADKKIDKVKIEALETSIKNNMLDVNGTDLEIFAKYGYKKIEDIKVKDYMKIVNEFKSIIKN